MLMLSPVMMVCTMKMIKVKARMEKTAIPTM